VFTHPGRSKPRTRDRPGAGPAPCAPDSPRGCHLGPAGLLVFPRRWRGARPHPRGAIPPAGRPQPWAGVVQGGSGGLIPIADRGVALARIAVDPR